MQSTIEKSRFLKIVRAADNRLGKKQKQSYPVRIICNGHATLLWHNADHGFAVQLPAAGDEFHVDTAASDLASAVRSYSGKTINLEPSAVSCGPYRRNLTKLEYTPEEKRDLPKEYYTAKFDAAQLAAAIKTALEFVDRSSNLRYRTDCIRIERDAVVATDARRLVAVDISTYCFDGDFAAMLDYAAAETLLACLPSVGTVQIDASLTKVEICWHDGQFWHNVPEGRFPRWRDIISERGRGNNAFSVSTAALADAIETTRTVRTEQGIGTVLLRRDSILQLAASTSLGDSEATIYLSFTPPRIWQVKIDTDLIRKVLPKSGHVCIDVGPEPGESPIFFRISGVSVAVMPMVM